MTPRSAADWWTGWRTACSATSRATGSGWWRVSRALRRWPAALPLATILVWTGGCGSVNTFYNASQAYERGEQLSAGLGDSLSAPARESFERAAEKSGIVLARYPDSRHAADALLLLGKSLARLGRYADATAAFRRYVERFPDREGAAEARLRMARSERSRGDLESARVALVPLLEPGPDGLPADVLYESAMLDLTAGSHAEASGAFRELLKRYPAFAREHRVALAFAEARLASRDYEAALEAYAVYREENVDVAARREVALRVARALALAGRSSEALATYDEILSDDPADTLAARVHVERGEILEASGRIPQAEEAYRRVAELAPGTEVASRATLRRGRIEWRRGGRRREALEILLDAFLHAPASAYGDSACAAAWAFARVIHFEQLATGKEMATEIDDPDLVRSTALFRFAEEVLDAESNPTAAAELFARLADGYPGSPWRPRALLAQGMLESSVGRESAAGATLRALIAEYPDTPEADSARRILGEPVPERPADFYAPHQALVTLAAALPDVEDPMVGIVDQLDRYAAARESRARDFDEELRGMRRGRAGGRGAIRPPGEEEPGPPEKGTGEQEEDDAGRLRGDRRELPPGVEP